MKKSKYGVSSACYYQWKANFGGLSVSERKRNRELASENARLKRMYADLALENTALKDLIDTHGLSVRKACQAFGF